MCEHHSTGPLEASLPAPAGPVRELAFTADGLGGLRRSVSEWATGERLGAERVEDLVLAVNELATNSVRHGGGGGALRLWREADTLLCEVRDDGHIQQALPGRDLPAPEAGSGRGLWLVNRLCDLVQIRSSPGRSVVRVHMRLS
ncbi:MAG TPA: ATP-binding protein [Solirubrobacteraceae bacterium]|nr:ATP-binding protein [Solirubrobacteraceae bacterium]